MVTSGIIVGSGKNQILTIVGCGIIEGSGNVSTFYNMRVHNNSRVLQKDQNVGRVWKTKWDSSW